MTAHTQRRPDVTPKAGKTFRAVSRLAIEDPKRRKLLALIAAFADAGEHSPRFKVLAERMGLHTCAVDPLLRKLEADGLLEVRWGDTRKRQRNRYRVLIPLSDGRRS